MTAGTDRAGPTRRFRTQRTEILSLAEGATKLAEFVAGTINDPRVHTTYSDEGREPVTVEDVYDMYGEEDAYAFVARARDSEEYVGVVEASRIDRRRGSTLFGTYVHPDWQNQGYPLEITAPVLDWLFRTMRMHRVWTLIGENADTSTLAGFEGFEREGVMRDADFIEGEYVDRHVVACLEDGWRAFKRSMRQELASFRAEDAVYPTLPDDGPGEDSTDPVDHGGSSATEYGKG